MGLGHQAVGDVHQEGQGLGHDPQALHIGLGLKALVFQVQDHVAGNAPGDEGQRTGGLLGAVLAVFVRPTAFYANGHLACSYGFSGSDSYRFYRVLMARARLARGHGSC
jgi:hypothetical protein